MKMRPLVISVSSTFEKCVNVNIFPFFDHLCIVSFLPDGERIRKRVEKQSLRRNNKLDLEEWRRAKDVAEGMPVCFQS